MVLNAQTEPDRDYTSLTLDGLRDSLLSPLEKIGLQFKSFVIENLTIDPNCNFKPWNNGTRWVSVSDQNKNKAKVCINKSVWQRAIAKGYDITTDVAIDVAINGLSLDKWYQVQIDAMAVRVSGQSRLEALRESIIKYCDEKGYFKRIKKSMPVIVRNIAIITSEQSSIESDIINQIGLHKSFIDSFRFNGKAEDLKSKIRRIGEINKHDLICLYRGGCEDEFMFVYSAPIVLDQIVQSPIPVVSAIGHERDNPPVQMVVDIGFASPSKFAAFVRQRNEDALNNASLVLERIQHHFKRYLSGLENQIVLVAGNIDHISNQLEKAATAKNHNRNMIFMIIIFLAILFCTWLLMR